jgi:hypothetical protein
MLQVAKKIHNVSDSGKMTVLFVHNAMPADVSSEKKKPKPRCLSISEMINHS